MRPPSTGITALLWTCCVILALLATLTMASPSSDDNLHRSVRASSENKVRQARFAKPSGIFGFFATLGNIKSLFNDQYNETTNALGRVLDLLRDGFTDTATPKPVNLMETTTSSEPNATTSTTTERYRISRRELGYILGKNYRGIQKLLRLELNDAKNQSRITINEYQQQYNKELAEKAISKTSTNLV